MKYLIIFWISLIILEVFAAEKSADEFVTAKFERVKVDIEEKDVINNKIIFSGNFTSEALVYVTYQVSTTEPILIHQTKKIIKSIPEFNVSEYSQNYQNITIIGVSPGHIYLGVNSTSEEFENRKSAYCLVTVIKSKIWDTVADVIGWMYFAAWSISFYPQVILNFKRRNVIGLNLDFVTLNVLGFFAYSCYNVSYFWIDFIKAEYAQKNPRGVNPVQVNDVIFSLHALFISTLTAVQCLIFQRGNQRVSRICILSMIILIIFIIIILIMAVVSFITWLKFLFCFSFVKIVITLIKYIPQAVMNYRRKSTDGWSIGNILLDFTGGSLSILQMLIGAYNNNDWYGLIGDPAKLCLGLFSIIFDILFVFQHYCLYRKKPAVVINVTESEEDNERQPLMYY